MSQQNLILICQHPTNLVEVFSFLVTRNSSPSDLLNLMMVSQSLFRVICLNDQFWSWFLQLRFPCNVCLSDSCQVVQIEKFNYYKLTIDPANLTGMPSFFKNECRARTSHKRLRRQWGMRFCSRLFTVGGRRSIEAMESEERKLQKILTLQESEIVHMNERAPRKSHGNIMSGHHHDNANNKKIETTPFTSTRASNTGTGTNPDCNRSHNVIRNMESFQVPVDGSSIEDLLNTFLHREHRELLGNSSKYKTQHRHSHCTAPTLTGEPNILQENQGMLITNGWRQVVLKQHLIPWIMHTESSHGRQNGSGRSGSRRSEGAAHMNINIHGNGLVQELLSAAVDLARAVGGDITPRSSSSSTSSSLLCCPKAVTTASPTPPTTAPLISTMRGKRSHFLVVPRFLCDWWRVATGRGLREFRGGRQEAAADDDDDDDDDDGDDDRDGYGDDETKEAEEEAEEEDGYNRNANMDKKCSSYDKQKQHQSGGEDSESPPPPPPSYHHDVLGYADDADASVPVLWFTNKALSQQRYSGDCTETCARVQNVLVAVRFFSPKQSPAPPQLRRPLSSSLSTATTAAAASALLTTENARPSTVDVDGVLSRVPPPLPLPLPLLQQSRSVCSSDRVTVIQPAAAAAERRSTGDGDGTGTGTGTGSSDEYSCCDPSRSSEKQGCSLPQQQRLLLQQKQQQVSDDFKEEEDDEYGYQCSNKRQSLVRTEQDQDEDDEGFVSYDSAYSSRTCTTSVAASAMVEEEEEKEEERKEEKEEEEEEEEEESCPSTGSVGKQQQQQQQQQRLPLNIRRKSSSASTAAVAANAPPPSSTTTATAKSKSAPRRGSITSNNARALSSATAAAAAPCAARIAGLVSRRESEGDSYGWPMSSSWVELICDYVDECP